jgi:hypothetical protein
MGLGLEMFDIRYWLVYVAATIIFEAWFIGRRSGIHWGKALAVSALANAITGLCCTNLASVGLHTSFVGSRLNPNPFWNAVVLFLGFGIISSVLETFIWVLFFREKTFFLRSFAAHVLGVPISLAILLIPADPYRGLEFTTLYQRRMVLERWAERELQSAIYESERIPTFRSVEEAINSTTEAGAEPDLWAAAYFPRLARFATAEERRLPYEWNRSISGRRIDSAKENWVWLIRPPIRGTYERLIEVDLSSGSVRGRTIGLPIE